MKHDLYIGEGEFPMPDEFDHALSTAQVVDRVTESIRQECHGDVIRIIIVTREAS